MSNTNSRIKQKTDTEIWTKKQWIEFYTQRILSHWKKQPSHFDLGEDYVNEIIKHLEGYYEDPLKRQLIETSY